ncbi:MAG TPA: GatB/YqeY domain-containing protein [Acidimicrobiia bacterium]|nr:GatB/YqeY domain-containing protein [Acidimicrobiia bacterium]
MTIAEELDAELKDAMRAKDVARRDVIRQVRSEIGIAKTAPGFDGDEGDDFHRAVIASYVKKMQKSLAEYEGLGERGQAMADKLRFEVEYLSRWLPSKLGESATAELVDRTIGELGAEGDPSASGRVIGAIMKAHRDDVDGALVNRIVRERLGG